MNPVAVADERVATSGRVLDFVLPPELEAHEPPEARGLARDQVRLLVSFRDSDRIVHARFTDLPGFLRPADLLVVNDSATLPAALKAHRPDGAAIALHLSTRLTDGLWIVEPRRANAAPGELVPPQVAEGERLALPGRGGATLLVPYADSHRLWVARLDLPQPVFDYLHRLGRPITYPYIHGEWPIEMYQTVFARVPGSAEMPSAARPFTPQVIAELARAGIGLAKITLHTGVASLEREEPLYEEFYTVPQKTAEAIRAARAAGGRIIAVGTTVVRALESAVDEDARVVAS
ncbi:MAG: S-adenosylmethionine:tRNA ribosyltransferase-isomerase, partial [bacterium]